MRNRPDSGRCSRGRPSLGPADAREQDRVALPALLERRVRERLARRVDRRPADQRLLEVDREVEARGERADTPTVALVISGPIPSPGRSVTSYESFCATIRSAAAPLRPPSCAAARGVTNARAPQTIARALCTRAAWSLLATPRTSSTSPRKFGSKTFGTASNDGGTTRAPERAECAALAHFPWRGSWRSGGLASHRSRASRRPRDGRHAR